VKFVTVAAIAAVFCFDLQRDLFNFELPVQHFDRGLPDGFALTCAINYQ
jgi:hypothetical protein